MRQLVWRPVLLLLCACGAGFSARAADGDFAWARRMGGMDGDVAYSIAVDGAGNVYTTGYFVDTVDFDPGNGVFNLTSLGAGDIFVQKLEAGGTLVWARAMGGTNSDGGQGIAVDGAGNVYTTGYFNGTADFDPRAGSVNLTSVGSIDIFLQKLDVNGHLVWARAVGGTGYDRVEGIAVDGAGNVYTSGFFRETVDFDPGNGEFNLTSAGDDDIFVQKLDTDGDFVWARGMGGTESDQGKGIAVDGAGNIFTTGCFRETVDFDPGAGTVNLTSAWSNDIFVQKLDADGNLVWARGMGGTASDEGFGIALDSEGNVYTTGDFEYTVDFDPGAGAANLTSAGQKDIFAQKLDADGNFVWARGMGGTGSDGGVGIAVDSAGNVYTTGQFRVSVDFDPGAGTVNLSSAGGTDIFVQKLDASGNLVWARRMGATGTDRGQGVAVDGVRNVYTTGTFSETVDFDPGAGTVNLSSAGVWDIFVSRLFGPPDTTPPNCITITPATTGPTNASSLAFNVAFDEDVQNFDALADVTLTHTGTMSAGLIITDGPAMYTATVTGIKGNGSFTLAVNTNSDVGDRTGNPLASSVTSVEVDVDNTRPWVRIESPSGWPVSSGGTVTYPITVGGSGSVNLVSGNVTINHSGTAGGSVNVVDGTTASPSVEITGVTGDGSYTISIAAGVAVDAATNTSLAVGPSRAVTVDNTAPVFSNVVATPTEAGADETVTITFDSSEFILGEPAVTVNGNLASLGAKAAFTYEYMVLPTDPIGPAMIEISGADIAGNANMLINSDAFTIVGAASEGEGAGEGGGETPTEHSADQDGDGEINLSELLRVIQLFNSQGYHCAENAGATEDGYLPGTNLGAQGCAPHASDYNPQDWDITLSELLRLIQFYNIGGYEACDGSEDSFCAASQG